MSYHVAVCVCCGYRSSLSTYRFRFGLFDYQFSLPPPCPLKLITIFAIHGANFGALPTNWLRFVALHQISLRPAVDKQKWCKP
jgi:hypothetical protein